MKRKFLKTLFFFVFLLLSVKFLIFSHEKDFFIGAIILLAFITISLLICERLKTFHTKVCETKKIFDQATKKFKEEKINYSKEILKSHHPSNLIALQIKCNHFTEDFEEEEKAYDDFMGKYPKFLIKIINKIS